ncbi:hypothetical protein [Mycoplana dimorpha]|uniref:hypothetical protein n=1 Tax=Mycoplana dimorpha TaxID=28320 RepID=UPI0011B22B2E|nr:hypothetical protein [Mycoplana dimorpha]
MKNLAITGGETKSDLSWVFPGTNPARHASLFQVLVTAPARIGDRAYSGGFARRLFLLTTVKLIGAKAMVEDFIHRLHLLHTSTEAAPAAVGRGEADPADGPDRLSRL